MEIEELQKLDDYKKELLGNAEEVQRVIRVVDELKNVDYVLEILKRNYTELREAIEETHNKMFPKPPTI